MSGIEFECRFGIGLSDASDQCSYLRIVFGRRDGRVLVGSQLVNTMGTWPLPMNYLSIADWDAVDRNLVQVADGLLSLFDILRPLMEDVMG
jgi:hypothetical protein